MRQESRLWNQLLDRFAMKFRCFRYALWFAGASFAILLCGCGRSTSGKSPQSAPAPPANVTVVHPHRGAITRSIILPAEIRPYAEATLYAKVAGYLKTIAVDKGDEVKEGALLADIEVPELVADRAKFQADVEVAAIDYRRLKEAQQKAPDLVVPLTVDNAKAKVDVAKAELARVETLLKFAKIKAPFSGIVTRRLVDPGAFISAPTASSPAQSAALLTVMDFSRVRVQAAVPEIEVPHVTVGLPVTVTVEELPGRNFTGSVTRFAHALDDTAKTMLTEIELPNPQMELRPGMYAIVKLAVEKKKDALLLPAQAVLVEKMKSSVFKVEANKAKKVSVKTGFNDGAAVEIMEGVTANDAVILVGKQPVTEGQPVEASEAK